MKLTRREAVAGFAAPMFLGSLRAAPADHPSMQFPKEARQRISVTSWPFRAYMDAPGNRDRKSDLPGMNMEAFVDQAVNRLGVNHVNPLLRHFPSDDPAYLSFFRKFLEKKEVHLVDLGLGGRNFSDTDSAARVEAIQFGKHGIDAASELGSPSARMHLNAKTTPPVETTAAALGELADYAQKKNIALLLENDNPVAEDPFFLAAVIDKVSNPFLRALPDMGNSLMPSGDAERNARGVSQMFDRAWNMCHVKSDVGNAHGKRFAVDLKRMFQIAKDHHYAGYYSMETDSPGDPFENTAALIRFTIREIA